MRVLLSASMRWRFHWRWSGPPNGDATSWFGLSALKRTPRPVIDQPANFVKATHKKPEIAAKLLAGGGIPAPITPSEFWRFMITQRAKWKDIVTTAAINAN